MDPNTTLDRIGDVFGLVNQLPWPLNVIVWTLLIGAALVVLLIKSIEFIGQDEGGLRKTFGAVKNPDKELGPGPHLLFPWAHSLEKISRLDRPIDLGVIRVNFDHFRVVHVQATVIFQVERLYGVRYRSHNVEAQIRAVAQAALRCAIKQAGEVDSEAVFDIFASYVKAEAEHVGLLARSLHLQEAIPDPAFTTAAALAGIGNIPAVLELLRTPIRESNKE